VVAAVLGLGHGMGLVVVAEGVERPDQLAVLRDMGCDEYQGFIDGHPAPLRDVLAATDRPSSGPPGRTPAAGSRRAQPPGVDSPPPARPWPGAAPAARPTPSGA
jgi:predicted signal transduction protein with EAL and GGDEF domain